MSKPWGSIGAWAADAERAEAEEKEAAAAAAGDSQSFPSLREAATTKQKKKTKMTLQEFTLGPGAAASRLTTDEMLRLPTGPKERSAEEMQYGGGGGFSSYGRQPGRVSRDEDGGRRHYGGFDDDRRGPPPRVSDYDQPSRADEVDNWALTKKPLQSFDSGGGRPNRYANLGGGGGGGGGGGFNSRADEVDNWGAGKKPMPPPRSSNFGSGFRDSGPEPDRWTRGGGGGGIGGGYRDSVPENDRWANQERSRLVLDPPKGERAVAEPVKSNRPSPFGAARPREDILAEKGLDWRKVDMEMEGKRPASSHSSRPGSAQSAQSEGTAVEGGVKPRPKVNPFGDAKPREVLLQEKGLDWRKIDLDLEHRSIDRPETQEEKILKEEIDVLKSELERQSASSAGRESLQGSEDQTSLHNLLLLKERDLELLTRELDDKIRFGQKAIERPGSGAGRAASYPERPGSGEGRAASYPERPGSGAGRVASFSEQPPSRSGSFEESRSFEFMDRPRSRGTGDAWTRQGDDRRAFSGGRERGFLGNREYRSGSGDRW